MENLERAIETTAKIRDELAAELTRAHQERALLEAMDTDALSSRVQARHAFNLALGILQTKLTEELTEVAVSLGVEQLTLTTLRDRAPVLGGRLAAVIGEIRALAASLGRLDELNQMLTQRALGFVRAHLNAILPKTSAYDRRGAAAADPVFTRRIRVA